MRHSYPMGNYLDCLWNIRVWVKAPNETEVCPEGNTSGKAARSLTDQGSSTWQHWISQQL